MSNRFQVIFFDAAGTLFRVRGSVADIYLRHAMNHGFKANEESLDKIQSGLCPCISGCAAGCLCSD